jgi:hypothetical protein
MFENAEINFLRYVVWIIFQQEDKAKDIKDLNYYYTVTKWQKYFFSTG